MMQNANAISLFPQPGQPAALVYCRPCLDVQLFSPYTAVLYRQQGDDYEETPDHERGNFLQRHSGHHLTALKKKKDKFSADRPVWDPFRVAYEEVTDGRESFLLKSWRADLATPRQYSLLRGHLAMTTTVTLPEEPLRSSLADCFGSYAPFLPSVMRALQRTVSLLPPDGLIPAYCSAEEPQLSFAYL